MYRIGAAIRRESETGELKLLLMTKASKKIDLGLHENAGIDGFLTKPIGLRICSRV